MSRVGLAGLELAQDKVFCPLALLKLAPADSVADRAWIKNLFIWFHQRPGRQTAAKHSHAAHLYAQAEARRRQAAGRRHAVSNLRRLVFLQTRSVFPRQSFQKNVQWIPCGRSVNTQRVSVKTQRGFRKRCIQTALTKSFLRVCVPRSMGGS